jgi:DNA polymerase III subunit beta
MHFNINSKTLEKLLAKVIPAVPARTPMPVLENFLFEIKDGLLTVYATDLEISLKSSISVDASEDIKIVIPAKLLFDIIKALKENQLKIEVEKNSKLKITAENGVYYIGYSPADDFPTIPSVSKSRELVIEGMELKKALDQTSFAMSREDMRPAMTGTLFEFSDEGLRFVATDGHRLVKFVNKAVVTSEEEQYIIPERAISVLSKILDQGELKINLSKTHASFVFEDLEFISRMIGEKYPSYNSVIPMENEHQLKVKTDELHAAVKRMILFSSSNSKQVKFSLKENALEVSAEDIDHGSSAKENIYCEYKGEAMDIGFNTLYVNEILSHINNEEIIFKLHSPTKACIIEPVEKTENEDMMVLLMPVRLNN